MIHLHRIVLNKVFVLIQIVQEVVHDRVSFILTNFDLLLALDHALLFGLETLVVHELVHGLLFFLQLGALF